MLAFAVLTPGPSWSAVALQLVVSFATLAAIPLSSWALDARQNRRAKQLRLEQDERDRLAAEEVAKVARKAEEARQALEASNKETARKLEELHRSQADGLAKAAKETEIVKQTLATTTAASQGKLDDIHTLVNSNMALQMGISAGALRRVADYSKGSSEGPADEAAAQLAESALHSHEAKQKIVDARIATTPQAPPEPATVEQKIDHAMTTAENMSDAIQHSIQVSSESNDAKLSEVIDAIKSLNQGTGDQDKKGEQS
jgi:hypothetical protein